MLTKDDLRILQAPFKADEHEFLKGNAYITEGAITSRIEQVDPAWKLEQINLFNRADSKQVICTVRLTINDTWRDGVGMSVITMTKQGDNEANEAEKSAATDAFKRAARLFGVGRYLLDLPGKVVDVQSMREWLGQSVGNTTQKPPPAAQKPPPQHPQAQSTAEPQADAKNSFFWFIEGKHPSWFLNPIRDCWQVAKAYIADPRHGIYQNEIEMKNSFIKRGIVVDNKLVETWGKMRAGEVIYCLFNRKALDEFEIDWLKIAPEDMAHTVSYHAALADEKAS